MSRAIVEMMRDRPGGGQLPGRITGEWKAVWSNGDEVYVKAPDIDAAREAAWAKHGPTEAKLIRLTAW